jgi:two-component system, LytTR family, response regulator LytT
VRVLIVEDEPVVARRLARLLREVEPRIETPEVAADFEGASALLGARSGGLLFLDLDLHGRDGFELLTRGLASGWRTIVVSAHTDRAIEAFEHGVVDFVPKPFLRERLALALERASTVQPNGRLRYLAALQGAGTAVVALDRIVAIHGADDYSEIEVADGRRLLNRKSLSVLARELPGPFVRIHRSHIVNLDFASGLERVAGGWHLLLQDGASLAVGRRAVAALRKRLL